MTEGADEDSPPPAGASPGHAPKETPEDAAAAGEGAGEESGGAEGGDGERSGPPGLAAAAAACCVCVDMEQVRGCLRSEKICILPILACLLSLALCTAGLKWVFVDKIFEYEPPTHLGPKRMGQDPVIFANPTLGLPVSPTFRPSSPPGPRTTPPPGATVRPEVIVEGQSPQVTQDSPTSALTHRTDPSAQPGTPTTPKPVRGGTPTTQPTVESNDIVPKLAATSTTPAVKTSSHVTRCSDSQKNYCVNGGECFTLEVTPGSTKFLCRCPNEFTGDRCQNYVMASFYKHLGIEFMEAEELYQKRVLTITGICIALLVVGIMCVVAYCKTKKQREKLHDRLRRSLRNERNNMAGMANGPHIPNPPLENVQLVNQYVSKNPMPAQHVIEKETETSFSTSQYTSSAQQSTMVTHTSSQSWSNGQSDSVLSGSRSVLVMSSASEASRLATPSRRGRLNATGGARELGGGYLNNSRDTPDSYRDSPYSERYVSAVTTPNRMSPAGLASPVTPGSPPSEASAPLSSLAASVPSMAVSPSGEEDRPLLFATPPRPRDLRHEHSENKRNSAHYNHGHDHSPPPSPLRIVEDDDYETTQEYEPTAAKEDANAAPPPQSLPKKLANTNNNNAHRAKRTKVNGHAGHKIESNSDSSSSSARSSSESETEDEHVGENTPFLGLQNPAALGLDAASALRPADGSRTNPALRLSPQDDLPARLSGAVANQDPIAV